MGTPEMRDQTGMVIQKQAPGMLQKMGLKQSPASDLTDWAEDTFSDKNKDAMQKWTARKTAMAGKATAYIVIPVVCLAIIMFLFSELLDRLQFNKLVKEKEKSDSKKNIEDIL